jgi:hypothetical protein
VVVFEDPCLKIVSHFFLSNDLWLECNESFVKQKLALVEVEQLMGFKETKISFLETGGKKLPVWRWIQTGPKSVNCLNFFKFA